MTASNPGNDHRLGANEAPPAIISIFLGNLEEILRRITNRKTCSISWRRETRSRSNIITKTSKRDPTDRNRTSPFADLQEINLKFRTSSINEPIILPKCSSNTAVAEILDEFAAIPRKSKW